MQDPNIGGVLHLAQPRPNMFNSSAHVTSHPGLMDPSNATRLQEAHSTTRHQMSMINDASDTDKRAIYKHPLFPLMALLFERCEQVTQTPDYPLVSSLKSDIQSFVRHYQQRIHDFEQSIGERPEVDTLMIKAIQILWIHLLELDKVNELCKDFCTRYIACLRTKLQNEQLLHIDAFESDFGGGDMMPSQPHVGHMQMNMPQMGSLNSNGVRDYDETQRRQSRHSSDEDKGYGNCLPIVNPSLPAPNPLFNYPIQELAMHDQNRKMVNSAYNTTSVDFGQQRAAGGMVDLPAHINNGPAHLPRSGMMHSMGRSNDSQDLLDDETEAKDTKYAIPKHALKILKTWFFQHLAHPYPTEDDKIKMADDCNISILQINNWFTNARHKLSSDKHGGEMGGVEGETHGRLFKSNTRTSNRNSNSESSTPTSTIYDCDNSLGDFADSEDKVKVATGHEEEESSKPLNSYNQSFTRQTEEVGMATSHVPLQEHNPLQLIMSASQLQDNCDDTLSNTEAKIGHNSHAEFNNCEENRI